MAPGPSVERTRALEILRDVARGVRADASFDRRAAGLDDRQRAFLMALAYGAIRRRGTITHHLDRLLDRGVGSLSRDLRSILELGAYQILYMDRVPVWSAVDESVELARRSLSGRARRTAPGLVNAVLRRLVRERDDLSFPDRIDPVAHLAVRYSHPKWLVERWIAERGESGTEALLTRNNEAPPVHLAIHPGRRTAEEVRDRLVSAGVEAISHPLDPEAIVVTRGARPDALAGWNEGEMWAQDLASQWVNTALRDSGADRLLDVCAGRGTKLCGWLADRPGGRAVALDVDRGRLRAVRESVDRLDLPTPLLVSADARHLPLTTTFPLVLADVPCSGTGVLRRRVDARWRRSPADIERFAALQRGIVASAADRVEPGGELLYATCSLEPEENERVVEWFLEMMPAFEVVPVPDSIPAAHRRGSYLATDPAIDDIDGLFAARLRRSKE